MMNKEKKVVIFCRSSEKFVEPTPWMFPWSAETSIYSQFVGDDLETCQAALEPVIDLVKLLSNGRPGEPVYICGAVSLGFAWLLGRKLARELPSAKVEFLQMERDKEKDINLKKYQVWPELKSYQVLPER